MMLCEAVSIEASNDKGGLSYQETRVGDPSRERDTAVERAEITVEDEEGKSKSRFTIRIICRHEFSVEELLHIVISVKDFKSIITHAGITSTIVKACYSRPASPMQLTYSDDGILSEFILMTIGEVRGGSATPAPNAPRAGPKRQASRQPVATASASKRATPAEMPPPPPRSASMRELSKTRDVRPSPPPPQPSIPSDALFMPRADDDNDKMWDPVNQEDDDDDMLLWGQGGGEIKGMFDD
ncbi:hypothetical protein M7I_4073 [Glarea lozoyensis 74030]|uniref:DNA repair protein rad9 n=1 Tax=Glarea lozoyensis (strain ATCC 74030 / MF5533) TaxID=1104152 RepID=H0EN70_GLAL7|nr:hypothetical protein M7I_4073 [Glarea lozoyensis 74030]